MTEQNQRLVHLFQLHLKTLGYAKGTQQALPSQVTEFLRQLQHKGIFHLHRVVPRHIQEHYEYLSQRPNMKKPGGLSSKMISHHIYAIRLFLSWQEQTGAVMENPISGLVFPAPESKPREILTPAEITRLYDSCINLREKAILGLFYGCGLRRSEGASLNVTDVQFRAGLLYVREGKGKRRRAVPMSGRVAGDLKNYLHNERYACPGETAMITNSMGKRTCGNSYNNDVKRIVERAGIKKDITLHCLRHSIATHLLDNGMSLEYVRDFLGHQYLEATQIYTRINRAL